MEEEKGRDRGDICRNDYFGLGCKEVRRVEMLNEGGDSIK